MERLKQIDQQISALEEKLSAVKGRETEVYTRIVGYYRAVKNWNKGKREEYNHRICFTSLEHSARETGVSAAASASESSKIIEFRQEEQESRENAAGFQYFYRKTCPNCPAVKRFIDKLEVAGDFIDADSPEGVATARENNVFSVPTVIFRNSQGKEIFRAKTVQEIKEHLPSALVCAV